MFLILCKLDQYNLRSDRVKLLEVIKADRPDLRDYSTHRQTPSTDNDSFLLFAAFSKAKPLISTAAHREFDFDLEHDLDTGLLLLPDPDVDLKARQQ